MTKSKYKDKSKSASQQCAASALLILHPTLQETPRKMNVYSYPHWASSYLPSTTYFVGLTLLQLLSGERMLPLNLMDLSLQKKVGIPFIMEDLHRSGKYDPSSSIP